MPTKHIAFDENLLLWDAEVHGTFTVATHYSTPINFSTLGINARGDKHYAVALSWPGVDSAGAMTTQLVMYSDATATPTAAIATFPQLDLATTQAVYQDAEMAVFPIPMVLTLAYFRAGLIIGTAVASAGVLTAGLVPLTH